MGQQSKRRATLQCHPFLIFKQYTGLVWYLGIHSLGNMTPVESTQLIWKMRFLRVFSGLPKNWSNCLHFCLSYISEFFSFLCVFVAYTMFISWIRMWKYKKTFSFWAICWISAREGWILIDWWKIWSNTLLFILFLKSSVAAVQLMQKEEFLQRKQDIRDANKNVHLSILNVAG